MTNSDLQLRIDADFYAYRSCQQNEIELDWGKDLTTISSNFKEVLNSFTSTIKGFTRQFKTNEDEVFLYFSSSPNYRKTIDPDYKGSRTKRKPVGYSRLVQWCRTHFVTLEEPTVEADDILGLHCHKNKEDFILISPDKDLGQISCRQYNGKEDFFVEEGEADLFFYQQVMSGDPVDGYKGIPGWGPAKARALLEKTPKEDWWERIVKMYEKAELTYDDALRNARLARILRPGEYDFDNSTPILWTP